MLFCCCEYLLEGLLRRALSPEEYCWDEDAAADV